MVRQSLNERAADAIDALFEVAFSDRNMSASEMRECLEIADTLREEEFSQESDASPCDRYDTPSVGQIVTDIKSGAPITVQRVINDRADNVYYTENYTVSHENELHPDDCPVVVATYPSSEEEYYFPVTRLDF